MKTRVIVAYKLTSNGFVPDSDELSEHLDAVLDALMNISGINDPELNATLAVGSVEIVLDLDAEDELVAAQRAIEAVRTAIGVAGGPSQSAMADGRFEVSAEPSALSA